MVVFAHQTTWRKPDGKTCWNYSMCRCSIHLSKGFYFIYVVYILCVAHSCWGTNYSRISRQIKYWVRKFLFFRFLWKLDAAIAASTAWWTRSFLHLSLKRCDRFTPVITEIKEQTDQGKCIFYSGWMALITEKTNGSMMEYQNCPQMH